MSGYYVNCFLSIEVVYHLFSSPCVCVCVKKMARLLANFDPSTAVSVLLSLFSKVQREVEREIVCVCVCVCVRVCVYHCGMRMNKNMVRTVSFLWVSPCVVIFSLPFTFHDRCALRSASKVCKL